MKVILTMAMSLNGMIAGEDGSEDFLAHENWTAFVKLASRIGNFAYGRKTYEAVLGWPQSYLKDLDNVVKVVISEDKSFDPQKGFVHIDNAKKVIDYLGENGFDEILVAGGSSTYSTFLNEGLADEIIAYVNPIVLGRGVSVFAEDMPESKLELLSTGTIADGIVELRYKVLK